MIGWAIIFAFLTLSVSVAVFVAPFTITEAWSWRDSATAGRLGRDVTGVEGLRIDIKNAGASCKLHIVNVDGAGDCTGIPDGDKIVFERAGESETLTHGDGKAIGLK